MYVENYLKIEMKSMHRREKCADKREKPDRNLIITKPHKELPWICPKYSV